MSKDTGLLNRNGRWYFRRRIPKDLVAYFGKREIKQSLKTSDFKEAKKLRNKAAAALDAQYDRARNQIQLSIPHANNRLAPYSVQEVEGRIISFVEKNSSRDEGEMVDMRASSRREVEAWSDENGELIACYRDDNHEQTLMDIATVERELFQLPLLERSFTPAERTQSRERIRRALLEIELRRRALLRNGSLEHSFDPFFSRPGTMTATLASTCNDYLEDYRRTTKAGQKRQEKVAAVIEIIKDFFGDILLSQVTRKQCRAFRDTLGQIPSNMRKHFPDRTVSLREIVELGAERKLPTLKFATQDSYLRTLREMLRWAVDERLIGSNPASSVMPTSERAAAKDSRDPFTSDDLSKIFNAPLYRGCLNDSDGYATSGVNHPKGTRYWIPLIALFSGMRLNEICQLNVADVVIRSDDFAFFQVSADNTDKRVKNRHSDRQVPVHSRLIDCGFLDFVRRRQQSGERKLFPDLKISRTGYFSDRFSRWFNERFLVSIGVKRTKISFHSFRHAFKDALRATGTTTEIHDAICGWNTIKGASQNYGSGFTVDQLKETVDRVGYDLDISHLANN